MCITKLSIFHIGLKYWAIPDKLCPPPLEDVSAAYAKSLEFHLLFYNFFVEIQSEENKKSLDFECLYGSFLKAV